ncbi:hypothetical protein [Pseudomonas sp. EA_65y_Pfl2_P78]|uniref:hypothetical protein n=1 Tax=Pseudomonas sp. EA_65y_Pfl2_P78 TaxID=3088695 RepID=UPI0030DD2A9F
MLSWLKSLSNADIQTIVSILNTQGRVTDEYGTGISSTVVERWDESCTSYLRSHGYTGGELRRTVAKAEDGSIIYILQS